MPLDIAAPHRSAARPAVAHVIAPAAFGGAESVVRALASGDRQRGGQARVVLLLQSAQPSPLGALLREAGVPVDEIRCGRRRYRREARQLAGWLADWKTDIVHTHVYHADLVGLWAARKASRRVVATMHGFTGGDLKNRFFQWLDVQALRRFDAVVCVSDTVRERARRAGLTGARVHHVPNGYFPQVPRPRREARVDLGIPDEGLVVGWVGRLSHEKGPDLLLDALAHTGAVSGTLVVVGDGPERAPLAARPAPGGWRIIWAGSRDRAGMLLPAFDALIISSRTEGLPMVLLEAMGAGTPVVSFAVGGIPEVVSSSSAFLAPPADPAALGAAIGAALTERAAAAARATAAAGILASRFGIAAWLERLDAVYDEVLQS